MLRFSAVPRVPALVCRVRLANKKDLSTEAAAGSVTTSAESQVGSQLRKSQASERALASQTGQKYGRKPKPVTLQEAIEPFIALEQQSDIRGCLKLVDLRTIMTIYRKFRDTRSPTDKPLHASDVVHCILTTLRMRQKVLRPMISKVRHNALNEQNPELKGYLDEIVEDVLAGKSYLSTFAMTYLLTAFGTLNCYKDVTTVWRALSTSQDLPADISQRARDPKVVGSFLRYADPETISLEEIESTYQDTAMRAGHHILLDDALASAYLRFGKLTKAAELYSHMCTVYSSKDWNATFSRLHNQILTESRDVKLSEALFDSAVKPTSHVKLHPTAATRFVELEFSTNGDFDQVIKRYHEAVARFAQGSSVVPVHHYQILTTTVVSLFFTKYPEESAEAFSKLCELISLETAPVIVLNTVLSLLAKHWPESAHIPTVMNAIKSKSPPRVDSLRVFLNSSQHVKSIPVETIKEWWSAREALPAKVDAFDYLALLHACNQPDRAQFFVDTVKKAGLEADSLALTRLPNFEHVQVCYNAAS